MAQVLIVDDDSAVLETLSIILLDAGHQVLKASDGLAALLLAEQKGHIDLLVTDVMMPGLNGFNLAKLSRGQKAATKVLYLTGDPVSAAQKLGSNAKYGKLLMKPIDPDELVREVAEALAA
jgi:DNA-binding response OmpR family regulator